VRDGIRPTDRAQRGLRIVDVAMLLGAPLVRRGAATADIALD